MNYEVNCYVEAQKQLPSREITLETKDGEFYYFKADILANLITYSTDKSIPANLVTITGKRAFEIISLNKKGIKPDSLEENGSGENDRSSNDLVEQESLTRFDKSKKKKKKNRSQEPKEKKNEEGKQQQQTEPKDNVQQQSNQQEAPEQQKGEKQREGEPTRNNERRRHNPRNDNRPGNRDRRNNPPQPQQQPQGE